MIVEWGDEGKGLKRDWIIVGDLTWGWLSVFEIGLCHPPMRGTGGTVMRIGIREGAYYRMILQDAKDEFLKTPKEFSKALQLSFLEALKLPHEFSKAIKKIKMP